ncbi:uncharacterized protein FIBRA_02928 [Fibroporia radiculosa]|uniref:DOMON domain-containing protein n=1 Tax=Fibroporia radiculosa TaxID=599839 RepID=J4HVP7_9APHY|nr:uncharacterized protein FIBRA_02928 [Fibroporia radiculosa]CCM00882.1 predicted protein [Fibroporia radiculosa]
MLSGSLLGYLFFVTLLPLSSLGAGVLKNVTIGSDNPSVLFSAGWSSALREGDVSEVVSSDRYGDWVELVLPVSTVAVYYVGFTQPDGALYAACVDCEEPWGRFMRVDAFDPHENDTPVTLLAFTGLDPERSHVLDVMNVRDPRFGYAGQITFAGAIVTVLEDDVISKWDNELSTASLALASAVKLTA